MPQKCVLIHHPQIPDDALGDTGKSPIPPSGGTTVVVPEEKYCEGKRRDKRPDPKRRLSPEDRGG
jgi:hypothetical protein